MESSAQPRRLKPHRSTLVVATLLTLLAMILIVPGITVGGGSGGCGEYFEAHPEELIAREGFASTSLHEHGWPWVYLRRQALYGSGGRRLFDIPWLSWSAWKDWNAECYLEFSLEHLLCNLLVGLILVLVCSIIWDWRLRQRKGLFRLRIADILIVVTIASISLGWHTFQTRAARLEEPHIEYLEDYDSGPISTYSSCVVSDAMGRLFGKRQPFSIPDRATHVRFESSLYDPEWFSIDESLSHLKALKVLRHLEISYDPEDIKFPFGFFSEVPQLRTLQLWGNYAENPLDLDVAKKLVQFQQIEQLVLYDRDAITIEAIDLLAEKIPDCEVVYVVDDPLDWGW